jgi:hypothetical protein
MAETPVTDFGEGLRSIAINGKTKKEIREGIGYAKCMSGRNCGH